MPSISTYTLHELFLDTEVNEDFEDFREADICKLEVLLLLEVLDGIADESFRI